MTKKKSDTIRILLVDDHPIVRDGIKSHLSSFDNLAVVGEAANGLEAVQKAIELLPDVVIMDINLPDINGLEATKRLLQALPDTRVLILSMHDDRNYVIESLRVGARGYVLKDTSPADLVNAIRQVHRGGAFFDPSVSNVLFDMKSIPAEPAPEAVISDLTPREREILALVAKGLSNKEIASKLFLSVRTVEAHRENIMRKLDIRGTAALTMYAISKGIVEAK